MKVIAKDPAMAALRCKLREAQEKRNEHEVIITRCVLQILGDLPEQDIQEGVECRQCFWYDKAAKRCRHKNGLGGRVYPTMFCSYGSYHYEEAEDGEEDFSEFDANADD